MKELGKVRDVFTIGYEYSRFNNKYMNIIENQSFSNLGNLTLWHAPKVNSRFLL